MDSFTANFNYCCGECNLSRLVWAGLLAFDCLPFCVSIELITSTLLGDGMPNEFELRNLFDGGDALGFSLVVQIFLNVLGDCFVNCGCGKTGHGKFDSDSAGG